MKLDKTHFVCQTFSQASEHQEVYKNFSDVEKKEVFFYLMQVAYGFVGKPWPKMDKTHFEIKHK